MPSYEPETRFVDAWIDIFGTEPIDLGDMLGLAFSGEADLAGSLSQLPDARPRTIDAWLDARRNTRYFDSSGRPHRFVREGTAWRLIPAPALETAA